MLLLTTLVSLLALLVSAQSSSNEGAKKKFDGRIVGGRHTTIATRPYLVKMIKRGHFACGAALVRPNVCVTAAHCTVGTKPDDVTIETGATGLHESGYRSLVRMIVDHPYYNARTQDNDIAVLHLEGRLVGPGLPGRTIKLCESRPPVGSQLIVSGWGRLSEKGQLATTLQTVELPVISQEACKAQYGNMITNNMICTHATGKDACSGDSGGPAVWQHCLGATVSFGVSCAHKAYAGVFCSIYDVKQWLDGVIENMGRL